MTEILQTESTIVNFLFYQWAIGYPLLIVLMIIFYLIYLVIKNPGLVDFAWVINHFFLGLLFFFLLSQQYSLRRVILFVLLGVWMLRLGGYILVTRIIPGERDPRYEELSRDKNPYLFFFINYQLQGFLVSLTSLPLFFDFFFDDNTIQFYVSIPIILIGIIGEAIADYQLYSYKQRKRLQRLQPNQDDDQQKPLVQVQQQRLQKNQKEIFQEGLWKKSRHPNLFFELMLWFGFALGGITDWVSLIGLIGPFILFLIMRYLTVPLSEKHMKDTRPEYREFQKRTNMFFLF